MSRSRYRFRQTAMRRSCSLGRCVVALSALLGLAACSSREAPPPETEMQSITASPPPPAPPVTGDFTLVEKARFGAAPFSTEREIADVAASPDGSLLVTRGGPRGALVLWDAAKGTEVGQLAIEGAEASVPSFSPDGKKVAAVVHGRGIVVWDVATRAIELEIPRRVGGQIFSLAYHPSGTTLASVAGDGEVALWDATKAGPARVLVATGPGGDAAFSPDGKVLVAMADKSTLASFDVLSGKRVAVLARDVDARKLLFSADGSRLVTAELTADRSYQAVVRDRAGKPLVALRGHTFFINALAITRDGKRVITGASDGTVRVWNAETGREISSLETPVKGIWSIALFAGERRVAAAGQGNGLFVFDLASGARVHASADHVGAVTSVAYSRDGAFLATADVSGRVAVRSTRSASSVHLPELGRAVRQVGFSLDGKQVLTVAGGELATWDSASGESIRRTPLSRSGAFVFSPDGRFVAVSDESRIVSLLDASTLEKRRTFGEAQAHDDQRQNLMTPSSVSFSPDGRSIAIARWDQPIMLWATETGALLSTLRAGTLFVVHAPKGDVLAAGSGVISKRGDRPGLMIIDAKSGEKLRDLDGDASAAFSPDGRWLVALRDGELRAFETASGRLITKTAAHGAVSFAIAPGGGQVVTGASDGSVRSFDVVPVGAP